MDDIVMILKILLLPQRSNHKILILEVYDKSMCFPRLSLWHKKLQIYPSYILPIVDQIHLFKELKILLFVVIMQIIVSTFLCINVSSKLHYIPIYYIIHIRIIIPSLLRNKCSPFGVEKIYIFELY